MDDTLAGPQLADTFEYRLWCNGVPEGKYLAHSFRVKLEASQHRLQGLDGRGKEQGRPLLCIKKRRDAKPVPGKDEPPGPGIPQGKGKLSVQAGEKIKTVFFVQVGYDLDIARGGESVPFLYQLLSQLDIIEDLAVCTDPDRFVCVGHGLSPGGQVNDGKTGMSEDDVPVTVHARFIRTPVGHGGQQVIHDSCVDACRVIVKYSGYAAHIYPPLITHVPPGRAHAPV